MRASRSSFREILTKPLWSLGVALAFVVVGAFIVGAF